MRSGLAATAILLTKVSLLSSPAIRCQTTAWSAAITGGLAVSRVTGHGCSGPTSLTTIGVVVIACLLAKRRISGT